MPMQDTEHIILMRRDDETDLQYHRRIVYAKLIDKQLPNVSYAELSEILYHKKLAEDVCRRLVYGSARTLQLMDKQNEKEISGDAIVAELEMKRLELAKERQRFFDQRREFNKLVAKTGRAEYIEDRIVCAAENVASKIGPCIASVKPEKSGDCDGVVVFSDWHYGMKTDNIFNTYNTSIAKERLADIVAKATSRLRMHGCENVHVFVLGDLIHGAIHTGARVCSEELVADQLMEASELLAQAVEQLSTAVTGNTYVYSTYGNHARTIQEKGDSVHRDNMERIVGWWMTERLKGHDDIVIMPDSGDEFLFANIRGHGFLAAHGDLDNVKESPKVLATVFQKRYGSDIEYMIFGDKHHHEAFDGLGIRSMLCEAMCGTDDYANDHRLYSDPGQLMMTVNDNGVDAEYHLKCE